MIGVVLAARNNAQWCDTVCRGHGLNTMSGALVWAVSQRSPAGYPDAVTVDRRATAAQTLSNVDSGPGCSVKDSFATLDLAGCGMQILFDAQWIWRPASTDVSQELSWRTVDRSAELAVWATAHGNAHAFRDILLVERDISILAVGDRKEPAAGAVLNRSGPVVGVSNFFCRGVDRGLVWRDVAAATSLEFPGLPLVGYESGEDLRHAVANGFATIGPLRVWGG